MIFPLKTANRRKLRGRVAPAPPGECDATSALARALIRIEDFVPMHEVVSEEANASGFLTRAHHVSEIDRVKAFFGCIINSCH